VGGCGPLSSSYWGTYDQGGNISEWTETGGQLDNRWIRGGSFTDGEERMANTATQTLGPLAERPEVGFRVAGRL